MKLKSAVILSVILHVSLFALMIFMPRADIKRETTYYVDLIQFSTGTGGPGGQSGGQEGQGQQAQLVEPETQPETTAKSDATVIETEEPAAKIKDLTVKKDEPVSKMRYPDKNSRKKKEKKPMVSVTRKKRTSTKDGKKTVSKRRRSSSNVLSTGISSGSGTGSGTGSGFGSGSGGFGNFPYAYYIDTLKNKISSSWYSSLVTPGLNGKFVAIVYFEIQRNGTVKGLKLEKKSGVNTIDLSAQRAIENAAPFPPLPSDFPSRYLVVHFKFEWEK